MQNRKPRFFRRSENRTQAWRADEHLGRYLLLAAAVVTFLIAGAGGWASTARISGAVIASGVLKVQSFSKSIQHLEGGLISEILVRDGDTVSAGDVLIRLDQTELVEEINAQESLVKSKADQIELLAVELDGLRQLEKQGLVQKTRLTALERQVAALAGEKTQHQANADRLRTRLARMEIRAPISGVIHGLAFHTLQGVVAPGQELMKIVPVTDELLVEARVSPADIDQVSPQQQAVVRLSSFNRSVTPEVGAEISHVSADLTYDQARDTSYYVVLLQLTDMKSDSMADVALVPGMPADVFIATGQRTVLSYLVKPLTDQFQRAMRE